ncbi:MAG: hypothetical protein U0T81_01315 [Saprospiraceae bacterium]
MVDQPEKNILEAIILLLNDRSVVLSQMSLLKCSGVEKNAI